MPRNILEAYKMLVFFLQPDERHLEALLRMRDLGGTLQGLER